jgi:NAD(P)-dependent dehydrogenase (short-subunit alcohol dehydrogenase family)
MMSDMSSQRGQERLLGGHRVLVTGAAGDIGAAICAELEAAGAEVVRCDLHARAGVIACDVTDESSTAAAFESAGRLSDIVHAAGVGSVGPVAEVELAEWNRVVAVNLTGSFVVAREAARRLGAGGTLTLLSSQGGLRGGARWSAYCASKFGVIGLMQCVAQELADRGIRVNAVCPGAVEGSMTDELIGRLAVMQGIEPAALRARYEAGCPMGRFADPREVGRTCVYLVSDLASYVSGSSLVVDGAELTA